MQSLQNLIQKRLHQHKLGLSGQAATGVYFANEYLVKTLKLNSNQARATMIKQAVLWVEVFHPILAQEIWGASLEMLNQIRQDCPGLKVSQIRTKTLTAS